ncbi:hypothetical protein [Enterococcus mundtii]|uniref:hypothetical protein n=1 Tax=Enterococcus mundtii TaxID=53346 RepID=UPI0011B20C74|nr:hypothetical protein [Enterococcus mundtii]
MMTFVLYNQTNGVAEAAHSEISSNTQKYEKLFSYVAAYFLELCASVTPSSKSPTSDFFYVKSPEVGKSYY